jgi:hypothetical protein
VAQQELDLFQLSTRGAAKAGAGAPQIMRRQLREAYRFCALLHDMPNHLLAHTFSPDLPSHPYAPEKLAELDIGVADPSTDLPINPIRHRDRADVATLADEIDNRPMAFTLLQVIKP